MGPSSRLSPRRWWNSWLPCGSATTSCGPTSRASTGSSTPGRPRPGRSPQRRSPTSARRWASGRSGSACNVCTVRLIDLELDLDVFAGPFDLLLTLILREEVDLLEVDLAEIVIEYIDHLERRGEIELEPGEAAEELLARLLDAHRYRGAAEELGERLRAESGHRFRSAPLPPSI